MHKTFKFIIEQINDLHIRLDSAKTLPEYAPCHFAFSCSALRHKPRQRHPSPAPVMLGFAPNVVDRCCSSKGLQLRSSSSVLRRPGRPSPHSSYKSRGRHFLASHPRPPVVNRYETELKFAVSKL